MTPRSVVGISESVLVDVMRERTRQEGFVEDGVFKWNCGSDFIGDYAKTAALGEELGEVCQAAQELHDPIDLPGCEEIPVKTRVVSLYDELIQVAACAIAWAESLERQHSLSS